MTNKAAWHSICIKEIDFVIIYLNFIPISNLHIGNNLSD